MTQILPTGQTISDKQIESIFEPRNPLGHKGTFGTAAILGGSAGMVGAAILAGRTALKAGAGKVLIGLTQSSCPVSYDSANPELMIHKAEDLLSRLDTCDAWGAGCGLGQSAAAIQSLRLLFSRRQGKPLVLDADGLNALSEGAASCTWGHGEVVMTPHPAEAGRLLGRTTKDIQADRVNAAQSISKQFKSWVVLKGAQTIVCAPDLSWQINRTGNVGLATAGSGDVLTGVLVSLLAQGFRPEIAVPAGVWIHGAAADWLVADGTGPIGLTAGELADAIRLIRNRRT